MILREMTRETYSEEDVPLYGERSDDGSPEESRNPNPRTHEGSLAGSFNVSGKTQVYEAGTTVELSRRRVPEQAIDADRTQHVASHLSSNSDFAACVQ